jgi:hypothetical protein
MFCDSSTVAYYSDSRWAFGFDIGFIDHYNTTADCISL